MAMDTETILSSKIALVSDDRGVMEQLKSLLAPQHVEFEVFPPVGFDPVKSLHHLPDVLLLDIVDKGLIALNIIQSMRCREHLRKIPIIALLSQPTREIILAIHQAGIADILTRGVDHGILLEKIRKYCRNFTKGGADHISSHASEHTETWGEGSAASFKRRVKTEVKSHLEVLPSLPTVVMEIMRLAESSKASATDFEEHIRHDQALTTRILRIANSSFFGQNRTIKSIRDAAVILGVRTLKSLAVAASSSQVLDRPAAGYGYGPGGLWKHSISCALGARFLAGKFNRDDNEAEELFVQGLLHDVGKLLLTNFVTEKAEEFREAIEKGSLSTLDAETLVLGTDHCSVGVEIAQHWNLPEEVRDTIEFHHDPVQDGNFRDHAALIHLANFFCHELNVGMAPQGFMPGQFDPEVGERLGLTRSGIQNLKEEFSTNLKEAGKLFSSMGGINHSEPRKKS